MAGAPTQFDPTISTAIVARGRYTEDEVVRIETLGRFHWRFLARRAILPFLAWPLFLGFFEPRAWTIPAGLLVATACWLIAVMWEPRAASRRRFRQSATLRGEIEIVLDRMGVICRSRLATAELSEVSCRWSHIAGAWGDDDEVLLLTASAARILIPRRFLPDSAEWQALAEIIRVAQPASPPIATPHDETERLPDDAIAFDVQLTWRDLAVAIEAYQPGARQFGVSVGVAFLLGVACVAIIAVIGGAVSGLSWRGVFHVVWLTFAAGAAVVLVVWVATSFVERPIRRLILWWQLRRGGDWSNPTRVILCDRGIEMRMADTTSLLAWSEFVDYRLGDGWVAMRFADGRLAVLPRRAASDARWSRLCMLIHRQVGRCRCGYALRGTASPTCPECGTPIAPPAHAAR